VDVVREMAMHFEAAGNWKRAVEALGAAAQHAEHRHARAEAAELRERAQRIEMREAKLPKAGIRDELPSPQDERRIDRDEFALSGDSSIRPSKNLTESGQEFDDFIF
jgi:hypothetical protein